MTALFRLLRSMHFWIGFFEGRERRFRKCPACGWEVDQSPKQEPLADYYGVTVPAKDVEAG